MYVCIKINNNNSNNKRHTCVCGGFDEDFKMHVKLNKSGFFGMLIIRQSENPGIQPSVCTCIPQYLSFLSVLCLCVCVCGYGGVYSQYMNPPLRLWRR